MKTLSESMQSAKSAIDYDPSAKYKPKAEDKKSTK